MSAPYHEFHAKWCGIALTIRHCPEWGRIHCGAVQHVEVESDGHVPIPITETGYRSHFMIGDQALADYGDDPVAFVLAWLDHEAKGRAWRAFEASWRHPSVTMLLLGIATLRRIAVLIFYGRINSLVFWSIYSPTLMRSLS